MDDFLKAVKEVNDLADFLDSSEYGEIPDYISTGSYKLNSIITGDYFKGIPAGRSISLEGESGVGKSFISGKIAAEAQRKGYKVIWFDSENATDKFFLKRLGVDTSKLIYLPVVTVEEFRNQSFKILEMLEEKQSKEKKAIKDKKEKERKERKDPTPDEPITKLILILDSLGNLSTKKEMNDLAEGKDANDMGLKAKIIKSMTRTLTGFLARTGTPLVIVNHGQWSREANPKIPSKFVPTGGLGVIYISSIRILLTKSQIKEKEDDNPESKSKVLTGNVLVAETRKNRFIPEGKKARIMVDFKTGINPYHGLIDDALQYGVLEHVKKLDKEGKVIGEGRKIRVPHLNENFEQYEFEDLNLAGKIWTGEVLQKLSEATFEHNQFSSVTDEIGEVYEEEIKEEGVQEPENVDKPKRGRKAKSNTTAEQSGKEQEGIQSESETPREE